MTRLIDADALEKAIYAWMPKDQETWLESDIPPIENLVVSMMMTIQEQPTVDAVPVIRCKDCKYYQQGHHSDDWLWCMMNHHYTDEEKYCAWAERKEE